MHSVVLDCLGMYGSLLRRICRAVYKVSPLFTIFTVSSQHCFAPFILAHTFIDYIHMSDYNTLLNPHLLQLPEGPWYLLSKERRDEFRELLTAVKTIETVLKSVRLDRLMELLQHNAIMGLEEIEVHLGVKPELPVDETSPNYVALERDLARVLRVHSKTLAISNARSYLEEALSAIRNRYEDDKEPNDKPKRRRNLRPRFTTANKSANTAEEAVRKEAEGLEHERQHQHQIEQQRQQQKQRVPSSLKKHARPAEDDDDDEKEQLGPHSKKGKHSIGSMGKGKDKGIPPPPGPVLRQCRLRRSYRKLK